MSKLLIRSVLAGVASVAIVGFVAGFIGLSLLFMNDQLTGQDSFFFDVNSRHLSALVATVLAIFAIGFFFGFRYFSKREKRRATQT